MTARIVVFGATGYTGDLTARALVRLGASPVLVARRADRVATLAAELGGLETAVADAADPASVAAVVRRGDVLVSTVGPFLKYGEPAVCAAAEVGAHYFDSTGEGPFIRDVFERFGPLAATTRSALVPAFGFDFVPGALAGGLALRKAGPDATSVDVGYFVSQFGTSGGTRASVVGVLLEEGFAFRDGRVSNERAGRRTRSFTVRGRDLHAVSVPGAEHFTLPEIHPTLREVGSFLGAPPVLARGMAASTILTAPVRRIAPLKALASAVAGRLVPGSTGGPSAEQRARASVTVVAEAISASGEPLATVTLTGPDPYDFTADALAWGATTAADGRLHGVGARGPVSAFGLDELAAGCAAIGLREV
ncbi:trans-acting enoyl reductase family protein [Antrihabitans sp. YC2-6]|uniref:saccharopine dehydrogenase family protein n=1 Tax=Antrihabitans sp. YC2-6 TaxID=2799498 RepID=UPI0018F54A0F|nr:saccharopine dehydrogenase NADP-binding domain-containing protein [Antrihabitans sp. YC2-6]MBJ8348128.1 saccharopine dehydrogenase NADP-binding domain-containing protein [Antrihabitans sp. YC2-6]